MGIAHLAYCRYGTHTRYRAVTPAAPHHLLLNAVATTAASRHKHQLIGAQSFCDAAPPRARLEQALAQFIKVASAKRPRTCTRDRLGAPCPIVPPDSCACVENIEHCEPEPNWAGDIKRSMAAPTTRESTPGTAIGVIGTWPQERRRPSTSQRCFHCSSTCAPPAGAPPNTLASNLSRIKTRSRPAPGLDVSRP